MKQEIYKNLRNNSKKFELTPPDRVWNRLEYKLDRLQFERKRNWKNKVVYAISIAAVFIVIISFIGLLKQDAHEIGINTRSEFIVNRTMNLDEDSRQAYDVHTLNDFYSKMDNNKYHKNFKSLKVNLNPKG